MAITVDTKKKVEPHWYTLESEKDNDEPASFKVHAVKGHVLDEVMHKADFTSPVPLTAKGVRTALLNGIKGCKNVLNSAGEEHEFSPKLLESLVWGDRQELAMEVVNKSKLTGDEIKNS